MRNLLKIRTGTNNSTHIKSTGVSHIVNVANKTSDESEFNHCYSNSVRECMNDDDVQLVSGWMLSDWDKERESCEAIYHYWNYNKTTQTHYDTTPLHASFDKDAHSYMQDDSIHRVWNDKRIEYKDDGWMYPSVIFRKGDRAFFNVYNQKTTQTFEAEVFDFTDNTIRDMHTHLLNEVYV